MNKNLMQTRFSKHLKDYNEHAKIQKRMAEKLIRLCSRKRYKNILEIGCGTGFLTEIAVNNLDFDNYTALDIVPECKPFINSIDKNIKFINADIETYNIDKKPDLIISNASLQWTRDFQKTVNALNSSLETEGEFLFTTFGKENFREIFYIMGVTLNYYSESELRSMLPNAIIYPQEIHIMSFNTPKDVLKHLKLTGVNGIENRTWTRKDLKSFEEAYSGLCVTRPTLTYNPLYIKFENKTVG